METEYDKELLYKLKNRINDGVVKIQPNTQYFFDLIEKYYPTGFNGIDWSKAELISFIDVSDTNAGTKQKKIKEFLELITENFPLLLNEDIIFVGDNLTTLGFEMKFSDFIKLNDYFFSLPQHAYVWFTKVQKCINLTFEDELFFG